MLRKMLTGWARFIIWTTEFFKKFRLFFSQILKRFNNDSLFSLNLYLGFNLFCELYMLFQIFFSICEFLRVNENNNSITTDIWSWSPRRNFSDEYQTEISERINDCPNTFFVEQSCSFFFLSHLILKKKYQK